MPRRRLAALVTAFALAVPASAAAQSAGDDQYQDPFGDDPGSSQGSDNPDSSTSSGDQTTAQTQVPTTPGAETAQASPGAEQLPRTGGDAGVLALSGVLLLASGVALRVRLAGRA